VRDYNIYSIFPWRLIESVDTEDEAWEVLGSIAVGLVYEVTDADGCIRDEFIPY